MAFGYEIFDASGNLIISNTGATGLILGQVEITAANQSGTVTNADFARGTPFWLFAPAFASPGNEPGVSVAGTTLTWTTPATPNYLGYIWYGIR